VTLKPMLHFALPAGYGIPPRGLLRLVQLAEEARFAGVTCGEFADTNSAALLAAASQVTKDLRLTTTVISVLTRSPALLAMTATTLADLSQGRFILGLGAGSPIVAGYHGQSFVDPVGRMDRTMGDLRTALGGNSLPEWGRFRLRRTEDRAVPLFVAAMNTRMLDLAGRLADGVILNLCGPSQLAEQASMVMRAHGNAGRTTPFAIAAPLWVDASGDVDRARRRFAQDMAPYLAVPSYRRAFIALSDEDAVDRGAAVWTDKGRAAGAEAFPASIIDAVLATDQRTLEGKARALHEAGCSDIYVTPLIHDPASAVDANAAITMAAEACVSAT
jgi:alkanesulfonate monooxygenase SsuD/methylene tetrahydromethanopterin reductase-like flavin-dependent oxidoreductase (luciferase family)